MNDLVVEKPKELTNLNQMSDRIESDQSKLGALKDKDVLIILGTTGSGKSTLANAIIHGSNAV